MTNKAQCHKHIDAAGLPYRTELILRRERKGFDSMLTNLVHSGKGPNTTARLTVEALEAALVSTEPLQAYSAAFLIGRCRASDTKDDEALTNRLELVLNGSADAGVQIETAMSLVLRGRRERGQGVLQTLLRDKNPLGDQYKAAFYLAQMGDPGGYPALVSTLHSEIPHYRLMALRHTIAFLPYQGQTIDGQVVDVKQLLVERLGDSDELVRSEVPFYLEELGVPDLRTILEPIANQDPSNTVRMAAQMVLDRQTPATQSKS